MERWDSLLLQRSALEDDLREAEADNRIFESEENRCEIDRIKDEISDIEEEMLEIQKAHKCDYKCPIDDSYLVYMREGHLYNLKTGEIIPNKGVYICPRCKREYLLVYKDVVE